MNDKEKWSRTKLEYQESGRQPAWEQLSEADRVRLRKEYDLGLQALQTAAFTIFRLNMPVYLLTVKEILGNPTPVSGDALAQGFAESSKVR